jgi:DNA repair protein RadD
MQLWTREHKPMMPRPYQEDALVALHHHVCNKPSNPCVVLPTGAGKSPVMAWAIERWAREYPPLRVVVLAHVKELVAQNADKMHRIWPEADIGIFAAGLGRRQVSHKITFASIDSVYQRWGEFEPFDIIIVDEAHRIPAKGEGKYRQFINGCRSINRDLRVVGFTATPYRLSSGPICHRDHILQDVCYEANVSDLIGQGYLCKLRSKVGQNQPDLTGVKKQGGEYVVKSLAQAVDKERIVADAVAEAVRILNAENRQGAIFFCVDLDHCAHVSAELRRHGWEAPPITSRTPHADRDRLVKAFTDGQLRAITNVNVLTEGFDATRTDAIVLLRPTQSKGLYSQMVGRGLRTDPRKPDCLVLDFAQCIGSHGPIDCLDAGEADLATCAKCQEVFSRAIGECPVCGTPVPKRAPAEIEAAAERERRMHEARPSDRSILSGEPETIEVSEVTVARHVKPGSPDSLRITYRSGLNQYREWVCLDHGGYAAAKAAGWWRRRFGEPVPTVDQALADMFLAHKLATRTKSITVRRVGKYTEVSGVTLTDEPVYAHTA